MTASTMTSGGADLAVTTWEAGTDESGAPRPPLVALHPGVADSRVWGWCAPAWAAAGHRVVAYDRRGFGFTRYRQESHDDLVDLLTVLDGAGIDRVVPVGNSLGGGLALDLAIARPERVAGLVLIAPSPSGYPSDEWPTSAPEAEQDELIERAGTADDVDLVNRLEVRYWLDGVAQPEGRVGGPARELLLDMNEQALRAAPTGDGAEREAAWDRLHRVEAPVLVIVGEHDLPGIIEMCEELVMALPDGRLRIIDDSAHCPSLDRPDELNAAVLSFLAELVDE